MNKFEQVSSEGHQMSLEGGQDQGYPHVSCLEGGVPMSRGEPCTVRSNASRGMTDRHVSKHYLPATSLAGGNNESNVNTL